MIRFSESIYIGHGVHRQEVYFRDNFVGYLVTQETNILSPLIEYYRIPDVEAEPEIGESGKEWITFKCFEDEDEAICYIKANFEQITHLIENADWD